MGLRVLLPLVRGLVQGRGVMRIRVHHLRAGCGRGQSGAVRVVAPVRAIHGPCGCHHAPRCPKPARAETIEGGNQTNFKDSLFLFSST